MAALGQGCYNLYIMAQDILSKDQELYSRLARAVLQATERLQAGACLEEDLPTAADLARTLNYRLEAVKKKLRTLKDEGLIHPISVSPKRYRFDLWALKALDEANPFYELFCDPDSPFRLPEV